MSVLEVAGIISCVAFSGILAASYVLLWGKVFEIEDDVKKLKERLK